MKFENIGIDGAALIRPEPFVDARGSFARIFCQDEFSEAGLRNMVAQVNLSANLVCGTLRGLHFQQGAAAEAKLIRCVRGSLYDVLVDVRPDSPTHLQHFGIELSPDNMLALYVPEGCAHGFLTLEDQTEAIYQVSTVYTPGAEGGLRYDDPALGIDWPRGVSVISDKDANWPLLDEGAVRS